MKNNDTATEEISLSEKRSYLVVKSNDLIREVKYNLSLQELRGFNYIISLIKPYSDKRDYSFTIKDYMEVCGITQGGRTYNQIKDSLVKLRNRSAWVKTNDDEESLIGFLSNVKIYKKSGVITVFLDEYLAPHLIKLKEQYTSYELANILKMKSQYSLRLFEILCSYRKMKKCELKIEDFRWMMGCDKVKSYDNFARLNARVIEPAVTEINETTDMDVEFETKCKGKKVVSIIFKINTKDAAERYNLYNRKFGLPEYEIEDEPSPDEDEEYDTIEAEDEDPKAKLDRIFAPSYDEWIENRKREMREEVSMRNYREDSQMSFFEILDDDTDEA